MRILFLILFFSSSVFAKSFEVRKTDITEVKDFQMSENRGRIYFVLTNITHIPDYPISIYLYSNCKKKKESWRKAGMLELLRFCDVDFEKTKINKSGTKVLVYAKKTDEDDLNSPNRSATAGPKCLKAKWHELDLKDYCLKD